jgi:LacI family transcriptional regulator
MRFEQLDLQSPVPLSLQLAELLEMKIRNKEIAVGQKFPIQGDLREIFKISDYTVNKALSILVKKGYVSRRQNHGTFVISSERKKGIDLERKNGICLVVCTGTLRRTFEEASFSKLISGIEGEVRKRGLHLLYKSINISDKELDFNDKKKDIAGLIITGGITPKHLKMVKKTKIPFVLIGDVLQKKQTDEKADVITTDDFQDIYLATKYLIDLGHKKIVYLASSFSEYPWDKEGLKGYLQALKDANIDCGSDLQIETGASSIEGEYLAMKKFLDKSIPFTSVIFKVLPSPYIGTMKAFKEKGIKVPEDVSLISPDEFPGITAVAHDNEYVGKITVGRLIERLADPDGKPERIIIPNKLIIGGSTRKIEN